METRGTPRQYNTAILMILDGDRDKAAQASGLPQEEIDILAAEMLPREGDEVEGSDEEQGAIITWTPPPGVGAPE